MNDVTRILGGRTMGVEFPSVEAVFTEALEIAAPAERSAYLDRACGGDPSLRRQVELLLDAHDRAGGGLESPAATPIVILGLTSRTEGPGAAVGP